MAFARDAGAGSASSSGAGGGGSATGSGGGRLGGGGATALAAGVSGGQALRSSDLLAQLRQRAAAAAAAGLAGTDGRGHDASQVGLQRTTARAVALRSFGRHTSRHGRKPSVRDYRCVAAFWVQLISPQFSVACADKPVLMCDTPLCSTCLA